MNVIITGCGRVGAMLARTMSAEGHNVAIVDSDPRAFRRLGPGFAGRTLRGKAFDRATMLAAGIEHADALASVTSGDNSNVVIAKVAREVWHVPRVVARIYDPRRADIYRRLGIPAISSVTWAVEEVRALILHGGVRTDAVFGDGSVRLVTVEVPPRLDGRPAGDLARAGELDVAVVVRSGASFMATSATPLRAGDQLHVIASAGALDALDSMLAP